MIKIKFKCENCGVKTNVKVDAMQYAVYAWVPKDWAVIGVSDPYVLCPGCTHESWPQKLTRHQLHPHMKLVS